MDIHGSSGHIFSIILNGVLKEFRVEITCSPTYNIRVHANYFSGATPTHCQVERQSAKVTRGECQGLNLPISWLGGSAQPDLT